MGKPMDMVCVRDLNIKELTLVLGITVSKYLEYIIGQGFYIKIFPQISRNNIIAKITVDRIMRVNGRTVVDTVWVWREEVDTFIEVNGPTKVKKDDTVFDRVPHQQQNTKALGTKVSKMVTESKPTLMEVN